MAYSAMAVANGFVKRAKDGRVTDLSPMKLQKLLFFAQSWHLALKREPLIDDFFARWKYGPVIPSLYHEFKEYGSSAIREYGAHTVRTRDELRMVRPTVPDEDTQTWALLDRIIEVYGGFSGAQLSAMTHESDGAWARTGGPDGGVIPNQDLARYIQPQAATAAA